MPFAAKSVPGGNSVRAPRSTMRNARPTTCTHGVPTRSYSKLRSSFAVEHRGERAHALARVLDEHGDERDVDVEDARDRDRQVAEDRVAAVGRHRRRRRAQRVLGALAPGDVGRDAAHRVGRRRPRRSAGTCATGRCARRRAPRRSPRTRTRGARRPTRRSWRRKCVRRSAGTASVSSRPRIASRGSPQPLERAVDEEEACRRGP